MLSERDYVLASYIAMYICSGMFVHVCLHVLVLLYHIYIAAWLVIKYLELYCMFMVITTMFSVDVNVQMGIITLLHSLRGSYII